MLTLAWALIAAALLLAPSPREWGDLGRAFGNVYDEIKHVLQPAAHFVLMAVGAWLLIRLLPERRPAIAFVNTMVIVISVAVVLELLQSCLPAHFARACDSDDLIPSALGAVCGGLAGLRIKVRRPD